VTYAPRELRATSDALLRDLDALVLLEEEKRAIPTSDPRVHDLADRIHEIAARVLAHTGAQRALTREVAAAPGPDVPIEAVRRSPAALLAEWRDIEQRRAAAEPGSAAEAELDILAERIREEYRAAFDDAARDGHQIV
jgi:hypothetical protein